MSKQSNLKTFTISIHKLPDFTYTVKAKDLNDGILKASKKYTKDVKQCLVEYIKLNESEINKWQKSLS